MNALVVLLALLLASPAHAIMLIGFGGGGGPITYTDNFNRSNETPLGGSWSRVTTGYGQINLSSNQLLSTDNSYGENVFRNSESYTDNQWSAAVNTTASWSAEIGGPTVRSTAPGGGTDFNGYMATVISTSAIEVYCAYGGTPSTSEQVGTSITGLSLVTNDNVALFVAGNVFTVKVNGSTVGTKTDTNNRIPSGGTPGIYINGTTARWDDWSGGNN